MAKRINRLKLPSSNVFLANTPKNVYPVPGDDALEEINSPEEADTQMQATKDDNSAEPAAGFGIKISAIASMTAPEGLEEDMEVFQNDNDKEDFAKDTSEIPTEPTPDQGNLLRSIAQS